MHPRRHHPIAGGSVTQASGVGPSRRYGRSRARFSGPTSRRPARHWSHERPVRRAIQASPCPASTSMPSPNGSPRPRSNTALDLPSTSSAAPGRQPSPPHAACCGKLVAAQWLQRSGSTRHPHYRTGPVAPGGAALPAGRPAGGPAVVARLRALASRCRRAWPAWRSTPSPSCSTTPSTTAAARPSRCRCGRRPRTCSCWCPTMAAASSSTSARPSPSTSPMLAMLELSKGKLTSQPERHTGRGLYFTSRLADVLDVHANAAAFQHRGLAGEPLAAGATRHAAGHLGLRGLCAGHPPQPRRGDAGPQPGRPRLRLRAHGGATAAARGQHAGRSNRARRRAASARVCSSSGGPSWTSKASRRSATASPTSCSACSRREHPGVELVPTHMTARVAALVASVQPIRSAR